MDASVGRKMTENPPELLLFITEFSSDGEEHVSILASRSSGDPDICIDRGSTETHISELGKFSLRLAMTVAGRPVRINTDRSVPSYCHMNRKALTVCTRDMHRTASIRSSHSSHQPRRSGYQWITVAVIRCDRGGAGWIRRRSARIFHFYCRLVCSRKTIIITSFI